MLASASKASWMFIARLPIRSAAWLKSLSRASHCDCAFAGLVALPAAAQKVVDGDTIDLDGNRWRLWGIDAPETHQASADGWPAGLEATTTMRRLIEGKVVT
jgi:endonuclease YncB( thermonuclease family)